jgi:hypothetical protein
MQALNGRRRPWSWGDGAYHVMMVAAAARRRPADDMDMVHPN